MVLTALAFACGDIQSGEKTALGPFSEAYTMEGVSGMLFATRPVALRGRTLMFALLLPLRRRLLGLPIENLVAREGLRGSLAITALTQGRLVVSRTVISQIPHRSSRSRKFDGSDC